MIGGSIVKGASHSFTFFLILIFALVVVGLVLVLANGSFNPNSNNNFNLSSDSNHTTNSSSDIQSLVVTVDLYPLEEFVSQIGGRYVKVVNILPDGASPHGFELSVSQAMKISNSNMFVYVGGPLDPWAEGLDVKGKKVSLFGIYKQKYNITPKNPHLWLNLVFDEYVVKQISQQLSFMDPKHAGYYNARANNYINNLSTLDSYAQAKFSRTNISKRSYITLHSAFYHFNERYNLSFMGLIYPVAGSEISGKDMRNLIQTAKERHVEYVFVEPQLNSKPMLLLAQEINATPLVLNPAPSISKEDRLNGRTFLSIMRQNINNLAMALR